MNLRIRTRCPERYNWMSDNGNHCQHVLGLGLRCTNKYKVGMVQLQDGSTRNSSPTSIVPLAFLLRGTNTYAVLDLRPHSDIYFSHLLQPANLPP